MDKTNKILIFLTFALIYSSIIFLAAQKHETEIEVKVSNALINDMLRSSNSTFVLSNQTLNETTYIRIKAPVSMVDFIVGLYELYTQERNRNG